MFSRRAICIFVDRCFGELYTNKREGILERKQIKKWTIQRNGQHRLHKTQEEDKQNKNTTQYVLDTTIRKETQITSIRHEPCYTQPEVKTLLNGFHSLLLKEL